MLGSVVVSHAQQSTFESFLESLKAVFDNGRKYVYKISVRSVLFVANNNLPNCKLVSHNLVIPPTRAEAYMNKLIMQNDTAKTKLVSFVSVTHITEL